MQTEVAQLAQFAAVSGDKAAPLDCAIIVPTLNERENIPVLIEALNRVLVGWTYEVIIVDDWSTDGTPDMVMAIAERHSNVRLIQRYGRRGLSTAVIEGMLSTMAPIVAVIDADMQHDEAILPKMIDAVMSGRDVAIGSRYCAEGSIGNWGGQRAQGSKIATWLSQRMLKTDVTDPMSGFFVVRRSAVVAALPRMSNVGFKVLLDILASSPSPLTVSEFPYQFRSRLAGESKLDSSVAIDFFMLLLDKKFGSVISPRLLMFAAVGSLGLLVHLTVLQLIMALPLSSIDIQNQFNIAQSAAVICAIAFNFTLNNMLTYRDRRLKGRALIFGLLSFYAVCGLGAVANVGVGSFVFRNDHNSILAGIAGAIVGSVWNYAASSLLTWRKRA
jgi:dolichol-phosphate mannosyltransferase